MKHWWSSEYVQYTAKWHDELIFFLFGIYRVLEKSSSIVVLNTYCLKHLDPAIFFQWSKFSMVPDSSGMMTSVCLWIEMIAEIIILFFLSVTVQQVRTIRAGVTFHWWIHHSFPNTSKLTNSLTFRRNALSSQRTTKWCASIESLTIFSVHSLGQGVSLKRVLYLLSSEAHQVFFLYEVALILLYRHPCAVNEPLASHDRDTILFYKAENTK